MDTRRYLFILLIAAIIGSRPLSPEISAGNNSRVVLENRHIRVTCDQKMYLTLFSKNNDIIQSFNQIDRRDSLILPSHYIRSGKRVFSDFEWDADQIEETEISTELGEGYQLGLLGICEDERGIKIQKKLYIESYKDFPGVLITRARYKNLSNTDIPITETWNSCLLLDASQVNPALRSHDFCTFYGTAGRPTPGFDGLIPSDLDIENYMGRTEALEGVKKGNGGVPVMNLWTGEMGIAIGSLEPQWINLYLPLKVQSDGKVMMAIRHDPGINLTAPFYLAPGASYQTLKTFMMFHTLDFYHPLAVFSELMSRLGVKMHTRYTNADYVSAWCSWNEVCTDAMASKQDVMLKEPVLSRLDELASLGIQQVIFDAGWFNNQGDWMPNRDPRAFPGGVNDLKQMIRHIHQQGFKVMLWISFLTADHGSDVAVKHPEWMILKASGENHLDRWSGNTMCPSLPAVQEYHRALARRLVGEYGADGFKVDGMYTCPPCYNSGHRHPDPNQSCQDFYKVFEAFYREAKSINPEVTVMECPCGTLAGFNTLPWISQTIAADPPDYRTVRRFAKVYRALKGPDSPYSSDYVNVEEGILRLPTAVGCGAIPQSFHGTTPDDSTFKYYQKWFGIYRQEMLSRCEYLNLYDIFFDIP